MCSIRHSFAGDVGSYKVRASRSAHRCSIASQRVALLAMRFSEDHGAFKQACLASGSGYFRAPRGLSFPSRERKCYRLQVVLFSTADRSWRETGSKLFVLWRCCALHEMERDTVSDESGKDFRKVRHRARRGLDRSHAKRQQGEQTF